MLGVGCVPGVDIAQEAQGRTPSGYERQGPARPGVLRSCGSQDAISTPRGTGALGSCLAQKYQTLVFVTGVEKLGAPVL